MASKDNPTIRVGLIGSGFMGRCHANAFRNVSSLFNLPVNIQLTCLADIDEATAQINARALGFSSSTACWQDMVTDPQIDIIAITAPNALHEEMATLAAAHGKSIYCEKPLSTTSQSALRMVHAANEASVITQVGYNFLRNPLFKLAKKMIEAGELGDIVSFRGRHAENYMGDPLQPHSFRTHLQGGGALADIGSHIISLARYLLGPMNKVNAHQKTVIKNRPLQFGSEETGPVEVDDISHVLVEFANGSIGSIDVCWLQTGRNMDLSFEITGTQGAIHFNQERMNEIHIYKPVQNSDETGFTKIETGPQHPPYGQFCPAPGHHIGFNDLKIIEVAELINAMLHGEPLFTDFKEGYQVQRTIEAMQTSADTGQWVIISE
jgi:predicted dehydrogenase